MVSDLDIYRSAQVLIRQHGEAAGFHAAQRVDALAEQGDREGQHVWKRILKAIEVLESREPDGAVN